MHYENVRSPPEAKNEVEDRAKDLINSHEKHGSHRHHDQHHHRCDPDLFPGRPGHFGRLLTDFLKELEWVQGCLLEANNQRGPAFPRIVAFITRSVTCLTGPPPSSRTSASCFQIQFAGRGGGPRTPNLRFWRPTLYQLSYTPNLASARACFTWIGWGTAVLN